MASRTEIKVHGAKNLTCLGFPGESGDPRVLVSGTNEEVRVRTAVICKTTPVPRWGKMNHVPLSVEYRTPNLNVVDPKPASQKLH